MKQHGHTVLVVDDEPVMRRLLSVELAAAGFRPVEARDAHEALEQVARHSPRIVITDWLMPGIDGLNFCRVLRRDDPWGFRYVIMLTVNSDGPRLMEAFEAGVDDFLSKPIEPGILLARMRAAVRMVEMDESLRAQNRQLAVANRRLAALATTDELTGLTNRRAAGERLAEQWAAATRYRRPLACAMVDIDHFKRLNDEHGHGVGDLVLRGVARTLATTCRETDVVARYGGEEFLVVLPGQTIEQAQLVAARCREAVEACAVRVDALVLKTTVSIGVAARTDLMSGPDLLVRSADEALYAAKAAGKNRVRVAQAPDTAPRSGALGATPAGGGGGC